jgi:chromosome segregation ATPase
VKALSERLKTKILSKKMTKLAELLTEIDRTLQVNNQNLTSEDSRLVALSQRCENIHSLLNKLDNSLDNWTKLNGGIEVPPEELQQALRDLNFTELTGHNLKTKLNQILNLVADNNQELADKIKDAEKELTKLLTNIQDQQALIANYQDQITILETKIKSNEQQAQQLNIKAGLVGASLASGLGGLSLILAK